MKKILLVVTTTIIASCGVPTNNSQAYPISPDEVDVGVIEQATTTTQGSGSEIILYFTDGEGNLVPVKRRLTDESLPNVLNELGEPPLTTEVSRSGAISLQTKFLAGMNPSLKDTEPNTGLITIEVDDEAEFRETTLSDPERTSLIYAQIVCTVDSYLLAGEEVAGVTIVDSQGPIPASDIDFQLIEGPAKPADFNNCQPKNEPEDVA